MGAPFMALTKMRYFDAYLESTKKMPCRFQPYRKLGAFHLKSVFFHTVARKYGFYASESHISQE